MQAPLSLMALAANRLSYLGQAQSVLAGNVANLDTPGYRPNGVMPFAAFLAGDAGSLAMTRTSAADIASPGASPAVSLPPDATAPGPQSPDGNGVDMDRALERISEADLQGQFAAGIYRTYMGLYKTALGQG